MARFKALPAQSMTASPGQGGLIPATLLKSVRGFLTVSITD